MRGFQILIFFARCAAWQESTLFGGEDPENFWGFGFFHGEILDSLKSSLGYVPGRDFTVEYIQDVSEVI
jgi:hypothetical protein